MQQVKKFVSHKDLETIYKSYAKPNIEYGDLIFHKQFISTERIEDEPHNDPYLIFHSNPSELDKKIEKIQYNAAKILTGAWKRTSQVKLYQMLGGWKSLQETKVLRKFCIHFETLKTKSPKHLYNILKKQLPVRPRRDGSLKVLRANKPVFRQSFCPPPLKPGISLAVISKK